MALDLTISTNTYAGEAAAQYVQAALLTGNSIANNYVTVQDGVKHKFTERPLTHSGIIQSAACAFTSGGSVTIDERTVTMEDFMVNLEFCKDDFLNTWDAALTGAGRNDLDLPRNFEEALIERVTAAVAEDIEFNLWQGDYDPSGTSPVHTTFQGLCADFEANGAGSNKVDLIDKTDGSTQITSFAVAEDVQFNMQRLVNALPSRLRNTDKYNIIVSPKTRDLYLEYLADQGYQDLYTSNDGSASARFQGYQVIAPNGMADDTIMFGEAANLKMYTDLAGDFSQVNIIDRTPIDGSDQVRLVMKWQAATMIPVLADVFMAYPDAA